MNKPKLKQEEDTYIRNRLSYIAEELYEGKADGYIDMHWAHNTIKKLLLIVFLNELVEKEEGES